MMKLFSILTVVFALIITSCGDKQEQLAVQGVLNIEGALFKYTAEGNGLPCVTFAGSESIGHKLYSDGLRKHIKFIHADQSDIKPENLKDITLNAIVDDIEKVRKAIGADKIAVMGHSMTGPLPLEYALKYPEHISHAILTGARPYTTHKYTTAVKQYWDSSASEERKEIHQKNLKKLAEKNMNGLSPTERWIEGYTADIPRFFFDPRFDMSHFWEGIQTNVDFMDHFKGVLMRDFDNTKNYHEIKTSVLVIAGRYDYWAPYFLWDDVKNIIPDFTFHLFENAGHNPMLEITEEFDSVVLEWIESKK